MSAPTFDILASGLDFPEGPAFDARGRLWLVELRGGRLMCLHDGQATHAHVGGAPNGIAVDAHGRVLFCDAQMGALRRYDPAADRAIILADAIDQTPLAKPNDLAFDAAGNLVFTCPGDSRTMPTGYVGVLKADGTVGRVADGLYFPNGLAFSPDGSELVIAETRRQRLWRGGWDAAQAQWRQPQPWVDVGGSVGPDGMAFDQAGRLYVCIFSAGHIKTIEPDGALHAVIDVPGANPTNCAFDPSGDKGLVVTEAERGQLLSFPDLGPGTPLFAGVPEPQTTGTA